MATSVWRKFQNIYLSGKLQLKKGAEITREDQLVSITSSTATITHEAHGNGRVIAFNLAAGIASTLPLATGSGKKLTVIVATTQTGDGVISCAGSDTFFGSVIHLQDAAATVTIAFEAAAGDNTITLDGSTTGGLKGDKWELIDIAAASWQVVGIGQATGVEATPFSTV